MKYLENEKRYLRTFNGARLLVVDSFISDQLDFWVNFPFNLFLYLVNALLYSQVLNREYHLLSLRFSLTSTTISSEMGLLSERSLLDFGKALSTVVQIAVTIKSAYLSRSPVDVSPEKSAEPKAASSDKTLG